MIGPEVWPVKVDASELELALVNLALNARDAMPDGGVIAVTAENVSVARGEVAADIEGEFVALRVSDTGAGIPPDVLPKVFDPFFTTKEVNKGSGLGLSQVHGFAHQSGGTVKIESELGKGTTVTLYLPRACETADEKPVEQEAERAGGGEVLLVEDNPEVAEVSSAMLEQLGYTVHVANGAAAALDAIAGRSFDLVISDIVMAGRMDGVALARAIRERRPQLPVLLVTGYSQAAADASKEFTVIRKPFQLADLSRRAAGMIAEARQPPTTNVVRLRNARRSVPSGEDK
jgi:CheY-like chemotaxis protein